ncbi:unnamed protein product [Owenia fusiformis]|uniref:Uncharacterized protein n=1 Tax=Owenia fusiformis TaxID=6347 RepID=A0A8J1TWR2_OWEFU|nr:unnamed protein product [Owenia fusiformis]
MKNLVEGLKKKGNHKEQTVGTRIIEFQYDDDSHHDHSSPSMKLERQKNVTVEFGVKEENTPLGNEGSLDLDTVKQIHKAREMLTSTSSDATFEHYIPRVSSLVISRQVSGSIVIMSQPRSACILRIHCL